MSGFDFLVLVLQSSNSSDLNAFLQVFSSLTSPVYRCDVQLMALTAMPTFDGKSENFELIEDLFQTSFKIHNQLTKEDKIKYFHSLKRGDALQTSKTSPSPTERILATPHTATDDNTFDSDDEPRRIYFLPSTPTPPPPPRKLKRKLSLGMSFPKRGECRSTFARLVDNCSLSRKTYQARQKQIKNSRLENFF